MGERNPLEKVFDRIVDDYKTRMKKADASDAVPLGSEKLRPRDARARFTSMTEQERSRFIQQNGVEAVLKMLRGRNG